MTHPSIRHVYQARARTATLSLMSRTLSLSDYAVLAALGEGPAHGFRLAGLFAKGGDLGGVWTVQRPQVYRALERLERLGHARVVEQIASESGPPRSVYTLTDTGKAALNAWLERPAPHLRDARTELLLKLAFLERRGLDPEPLLTAQTAHFRRIRDEYRARLEHATGAERLALEWRSVMAEAAREFLAKRSL